MGTRFSVWLSSGYALVFIYTPIRCHCHFPLDVAGVISVGKIQIVIGI